MKFPTSKIVMITAHDNASDRQKAKHEGVDFFIGKPFSRELIYKAIEATGGQ
jgi:CheY-like chemotaxis protein